MLKRFIILLSLCVAFTLAPSLLLAKMVSISGEDVNLRSGPGTKYPVRWKYGEGFPLKVLEERGNWLKVEDFENDTGWLYKKLASHVGHMIVKVNKDKDITINIRSGPGTNFKVIGKAYYGVVFKTITQRDGWAKVRHESGLEGWIERSLLWGF